MFNLEDIDIDEDAVKSARINQLSKELASLRAQLNIPASIRNTIGGAAIGAGLGMGAIGTVSIEARTFGLTGDLAVGNVGDVLPVYWKPINDTQTASWEQINTEN